MNENAQLNGELQVANKKLDQSNKGFWLGIGAGLPLGGAGFVGYEIKNNLVFTSAGYNDGPHINIGYARKLK